MLTLEIMSRQILPYHKHVLPPSYLINRFSILGTFLLLCFYFSFSFLQFFLIYNLDLNWYDYYKYYNNNNITVKNPLASTVFSFNRWTLHCIWDQLLNRRMVTWNLFVIYLSFHWLWITRVRRQRKLRIQLG